MFSNTLKPAWLVCAALAASGLLAGQSDELARRAQAASAAMRAGDFRAAERHNRAILDLAPTLAEAHINLGMSLFAQKRFEDAGAAFHQGVKLKPELANGWLFLGISEFNLNRADRAIAALERYRAAKPDDFQGHYYLGLALMSLSRFGEAENSLQGALRIRPRDMDALYHLAECYLEQSRANGAAKAEFQRQYEQTVRAMEFADANSPRIAQLRAAYYQANGETAKAREELERLLGAGPKIRGLHYTLGCLYIESREYAKAREQLEAELKLDAPFPRTYLQLGHTLVELGEPESALPLLDKAIEAEPTSGVPWVEVGRANKALNRHDKSAEAFTRAIGLGEKRSAVYYQLALAYRALGKTDQWREALQRSQELRRSEVPAATAPHNVDAEIDEARQALSSGRYDDAVRGFESAWRRSPRCDVPFYAGLAEQRRKNLGKAVIAFRSAAACNPRFLAAQLALAEVYVEMGDDNGALAAYESALTTAPANTNALRAASRIYLRNQMNEQAVKALETLASIEKGDIQAIADLGAAYAATSRFVDAEARFREALKLDPSMPGALTGLAGVLLRNGAVPAAIELLGQAVKVAPEAYEPRYVLGAAQLQAGNFEEAVTALESAANRNGSDPEVHYRLATAYAKLGRGEDSKRALAEFSARRAEAGRAGEAQREATALVRDAQSAIDKGDLVSAARLVEQAVARQPGEPRNLFRLAGIYYDQGRHSEASEKVRAAIDLAPAEWSYHFLHGLIEKARGNKPQARASFETAVRLNPEAAEARQQLRELPQE